VRRRPVQLRDAEAKRRTRLTTSPPASVVLSPGSSFGFESERDMANQIISNSEIARCGHKSSAQYRTTNERRVSGQFFGLRSVETNSDARNKQRQ
jgi:hypothetical protein